MIDLHCHILPGLDDGPADIELSVEMAEIAALDGITRLVATPHIKNPIHPPERIIELVRQLNNRLVQEEIALEILPAAEVYAFLDPALFKGYTINNTDYILVEFPLWQIPWNIKEILVGMQRMGLKPIIAHPERNPYVVEHPALLAKFRETGILVQITAASLIGNFGPEIQECTERLLTMELVQFIASDAHSSGLRRSVLSAALRRAKEFLGSEKAMRLVLGNPAAVLNGETLA